MQDEDFAVPGVSSGVLGAVHAGLERILHERNGADLLVGGWVYAGDQPVYVFRQSISGGRVAVPCLVRLLVLESAIVVVHLHARSRDGYDGLTTGCVGHTRERICLGEITLVDVEPK